MLVYDVVAFSMIAYKSRPLLLLQTSGMNLLTLMLLDGEYRSLEIGDKALNQYIGSIYFGVMIAANIANILIFLVGFLSPQSIIYYLQSIIQYGGMSCSQHTPIKLPSNPDLVVHSRCGHDLHECVCMLNHFIPTEVTVSVAYPPS